MLTRNSEKGFTLMELMITVAIVGILAAIAYPSYREHIRKTKRAEAQGALMAAANAMERWRARNNFDYRDAMLGNTAASGNCATAAADQTVFANQVPLDGGTAYYNLTLACNQSTYTITATPTGSMAGDGAMTIDQAGAKTWADPACGASKSNWQPKGQGC